MEGDRGGTASPHARHRPGTHYNITALPRGLWWRFRTPWIPRGRMPRRGRWDCQGRSHQAHARVGRSVHTSSKSEVQWVRRGAAGRPSGRRHSGMQRPQNTTNTMAAPEGAAAVRPPPPSLSSPLAPLPSSADSRTRGCWRGRSPCRPKPGGIKPNAATTGGARDGGQWGGHTRRNAAVMRAVN